MLTSSSSECRESSGITDLESSGITDLTLKRVFDPASVPFLLPQPGPKSLQTWLLMSVRKTDVSRACGVWCWPVGLEGKIERASLPEQQQKPLPRKLKWSGSYHTAPGPQTNQTPTQPTAVSHSALCSLRTGELDTHSGSLARSQGEDWPRKSGRRAFRWKLPIPDRSPPRRKNRCLRQKKKKLFFKNIYSPRICSSNKYLLISCCVPGLVPGAKNTRFLSTHTHVQAKRKP